MVSATIILPNAGKNMLKPVVLCLFVSLLMIFVNDFQLSKTIETTTTSTTSSSATTASTTTAAVATDGDSSRISYRLTPGPRTSIGKQTVIPWFCRNHHDGYYPDRRRPLPTEMRPYFNFSTTLRTNLKILVMGDSIGIQLSEYLQDLLRANEWTYDEDNNSTSFAAPPEPVVLKITKGMNKDPAIHVTAPLEYHANRKNSGTIAGYRLIGMFLREQHGWAPPNYNAGWLLKDVQALRDYVTHATTSSNDEAIQTTTTQNITIHSEKMVLNYTSSGDFDVMVFRIPSPSWIPFAKVTPDTLEETIQLANELFGVRVVVFTTMHYVNNVLNNEMRQEMDHKNQMIIDFAQNWTHQNNNSTTGGVRTVYVLDQGRLNDELMEWNARLLGFNTSDRNHVYTDDKLQTTNRRKTRVDYSRTIAQNCAEKVPANSTDCLRNSISRDGMHPCFNTVGPRLAAAVACQLQCAFDREEEWEVSWSCSQDCNERFMNSTNLIRA